MGDAYIESSFIYNKIERSWNIVWPHGHEKVKVIGYL